jgi:hypothetical protein
LLKGVTCGCEEVSESDGFDLSPDEGVVTLHGDFDGCSRKRFLDRESGVEAQPHSVTTMSIAPSFRVVDLRNVLIL